MSVFVLAAAATPSAPDEGPDTITTLLEAPTPLGSAERGDDEGNHLSECSAGNGGEALDASAEPVTEFSCGPEEKDGYLGGTLVCARGGGGASELHQYDGGLEEGGSQNGLDCCLKPKGPAVSVMDRLTEIHGSEALSFSSALAAQVAARSHSLIAMEEQTFGDEEEELVGEESDRRTPRKD